MRLKIRSHLITLFLAAFIGLGPSSCLGQRSVTAPTHAPAPHRKLAGVPNFGEVTPYLYRGAAPTRKGFEELARMGINIVIDARGDNKHRRELITKLGMQYVALPWHCPFPRDKTFAEFLRLIRDNRGKKIFVFCRLGADRTGMMIAAYRMAEQGWSAKQARAEMNAYGFNFGHHFLCPGLAAYESRFPEEFKTSPAFKDLRKDASPYTK